MEEVVSLSRSGNIPRQSIALNVAQGVSYVSNRQETGHTSYKCPRNVLGDRARPKKKKRDVDEESENVKAWLASDGDDIGGAAFMF